MIVLSFHFDCSNKKNTITIAVPILTFFSPLCTLPSITLTIHIVWVSEWHFKWLLSAKNRFSFYLHSHIAAAAVLLLCIIEFFHIYTYTHRRHNRHWHKNDNNLKLHLLHFHFHLMRCKSSVFSPIFNQCTTVEWDNKNTCSSFISSMYICGIMTSMWH